MTYIPVQQAEHTTSPAGANPSATASFANAVITGHSVFVQVAWPSTAGDTVTSITDDAGNSYTLVDLARESASGLSAQTAYCIGVTGNPTTITAHLSTSATPFDVEVMIAEYSGIGSLNAHAINPQNAPGTATDALTSTAATTTVSGCLIFGQCSDADGQSASAGTGFTVRGNFVAPAVTMFSEDETQGTAGSVAATFTAGTGTNRFVTSMMAFTPGANAFGDLLGTLSVGKTSVTNPLSATGSVSVSVGDLIVAAYAELTSDTVTGVTDNLGNTYTAQNAGSAATAAGRAFYSRVTVAGTLTSVNAATTASTDDAALSVACFSGGSLGFASPPIDANPANTTGDVTSPFTCPATGTLAQAIEVVVGWMSLTRGQTNTASPSPFALAKNQASSTANAASSVCAALCFDLVSSTASSSPSFTCASGTFSGSVLGTMSFKQASPAPPAYTPYDPWPLAAPLLAQ